MAMTSGSSRKMDTSCGAQAKPSRADSQQQHERHLDAEPEALLHPVVQAGTVVEAAHRLEALTEADHGRAAEHHDPLHHAHSGDGRVSIGTGGLIEADGSHAGKTLPGQRRQTALEDPQIIIRLQLHMGKMDAEGYRPWCSRSAAGKS